MRRHFQFEDSQTAVLIQYSQEQLRVAMQNAEALDGLINTFVSYERSEVLDFRAAIIRFKEDVPKILEALRDTINHQEAGNIEFQERRNALLEVCRQSINPEIEGFDIHEMLIQHILTEDIFTNIFHESQFHRENNIARELSEIINMFFTGNTCRNTLKSIEHYYAVIRRKSENIANHHEKQKFLKAIYENFYKAYNPKAVDRLGIVYTPNEIVRFMIESADRLVYEHFGKLLSDSRSRNSRPLYRYRNLYNQLIAVTNHTQTPFLVQAANCIPALDVGGRPTQCLPIYRYDKNGNRIDNITDWGLTQFQTYYNNTTITKQDIFRYTYAVLHHPAYRTKYELNLKREFPRLPFYLNFHRWANWGKALMDLHLNYETITPYPLKRVEIATKDNPKAKLKAEKTSGMITLDENTQLTNVPAIAWNYKLGNRSALEWMLDQYKETQRPDDR